MKKKTEWALKFNYAWIIIIISFLMIFANYGFCSSNRGLYLTAITEALDMKRSIFSLSDTCRYAATSVVSVFFGTLIRRFGTRKLIAAGYLCLIGFAVCYAVGTNIWVFCIGSGLLGIGIAWTTTTMVGSIINKWCTRNRGVIMGVVLSANGLGGAVAAQIITPVIFQEGNQFGYRNAYWMVAAILLVVGVLAIILYRENSAPEIISGLSNTKKIKSNDWQGIDFKEIKKRPYYYASIIAMFLTGLSLTVTSTSSVYFQDIGMEPAFVAAIYSISSLALTGSKFLAGFLYDKLGVRVTVIICNIAAIIAPAMVWFAANTEFGGILAIVHIIINAVSLPLQTILIPIFSNEMYGTRASDQVSGILSSACTAGFAIGGPLINLVYDYLGTYKPAYPLATVSMVAVTVILLLVMKSAQREKSENE